MSTPQPDRTLEHLLALQKERHDAEVRALKERHSAAINHLKTSAPYRVGEMFVDLRQRQGWRRLPGRLGSLVRELRNRRADVPIPMGWTAVTPRAELSVLSVLDEFTHACLATEVDLIPASRSNWNEQIAGVSLVLLETAWRGNGGTWKYTMSKFESSNDLGRLLQAAKTRGLPTALWNKEDPVSYETFLDLARHVDHVFTSDSNAVHRYRRELGHGRVHPMMFAAQPSIHNPMGSNLRRGTVCFAGAWRGKKYPDRARQLEQMLDSARSVASVVIFDREPAAYTEGEGFPQRFHNYIGGSLSYEDMLSEYRRHACFLNVNSVTQSPTMMSRRVFELLACRTPVVSTPSRAIDEHLAGVVATPTTSADMVNTIAAFVQDVDHRDRTGHLGYRIVMSEHTYQHRMQQMLTAIGSFDFPGPTEPSIDIICVSNRPENLDRVLRNVRCQTYRNTRLIFVMNSDRFDREIVRSALTEFPGARLLDIPEHKTLGACMNAARAESTADFFAKFDDDDMYGPHYLSDTVLAMRFADASIYGKRAFHAYVQSRDETVLRYGSKEFSYVTFVMGASIIARNADVDGIPFPEIPEGTDTRFQEACHEAGLKIFATDRFGFIAMRHADAAQHTWQISDEKFLTNTRSLGAGCRADDVLI